MNEIKVQFELDVQEDGYPPIGTEALNGILIAPNLVKLDNTPFFAEGVAVGDILKCTSTKNPKYMKYDSLIDASGNISLSIMLLDRSFAEEIYQYFKSRGCFCEYGKFADFEMLAVSLDKDFDYDEILPYLNEQEDLEKISYAELCI